MCNFMLSKMYLFVTVWRTYRTEADEEFDTFNANVFPGIPSNSCLYFTVENIEFDLPGTWIVGNAT